MALTTKNLRYNLITAELDLDLGMAKFKYRDLDYFPKVLVYGGMSLVTRSGVKGMHEEHTLCLDIKDDETERFIIELIETSLNPIPGGISQSYSRGYGKFASSNFSMKQLNNGHETWCV